MKRFIILLFVIPLVLLGCSSEETSTNKKIETAVVFGSSLAEIIDESKINVIGTTTDAFENDIISGVENIGELMNPNMELIVDLNPDIVVLSSNHPKYESISTLLESANVDILTIDYNSFDEYKDAIKEISTLTDDENYFNKMVDNAQSAVDKYIEKSSDLSSKKALVLRSSASSFNTIDNAYFSNEIIENMNIENIANVNDKISADLSIEYILEENPDYIFIIQMGDEDSMLGYENYLAENSTWSNLSAVKQGNVYFLPKELFHLKPNTKWGEAYEYIYEILQQ